MADRKKFYEEINEQLHTIVMKLIEEHPELEGAAIALTYTTELGDLPACLVVGDLKDPFLICRMGLQVAKLQAMVSQGISQHIAQAVDAHAHLTQETNAKRQDEDPPSRPQAEDPCAGIGQSGRPPRTSENS